MKRAVLLLLILVMLLSGCETSTPSESVQTRAEDEEETTNIETDIGCEEQPTVLTVYVIGTPVYSRIEGKEVTYHITDYSIGPFGPLTNAPQDYGHMYYESFENFEKETGIQLNVSFFQNMDQMELYMLDDRIEDNDPDIIISNYRGSGTAAEHDNIYRLIYNGWFADMMPHMTVDEIYDGGEYYNEVLQAGILEGKQYILPLCFNMNALFTSTEDMQEAGVVVENGMESEQLLEQIRQACAMAGPGELVIDSLSLWSVSTAFVQDYWESTGLPVVNYETGEATIDREVFEDVAACFKEYMSMNVVGDWNTAAKDTRQYLNNHDWSAYISPGRIETLDENMNGFFKWTESGLEKMEQSTFFYENGTRIAEAHSLFGQCAVLNSLYTDLEEEMVMVSVPMYGSEQYMAQVQWFGGVLAESEYPYHSYQLLKYILDQEYDPYYVIPVKKTNAEAVLEELGSTVYTIPLWLGASWHYDEDFSDPAEVYDIQPLPENVIEQLQYMLDHIGGAVLPQASAYNPILWHMEAYAFDIETLDQAYEGACEDMEEYAKYIMAGDSQMSFKGDSYPYSAIE